MSETLHTPTEVAQLLRVARGTVYRWIREGRLPVRRTPGGYPRIHPDDVAALRPAKGEGR
ncbi:MAG: excisionase family DNA-binding protein [Planctomycetes bacterium]|nr:excisionase family DNA-binding protein [Planctomycetota bacterium]MCB9825803.1 excisionase family DNA-binding protein [Planctomycetota bacterium]MCB9829088.1 excisionase family DNA-binding protein [Planctomycetota bacterium]MCB9901202.1 excisionase family DNA-binding protein [Planctomycetota bacterium]